MTDEKAPDFIHILSTCEKGHVEAVAVKDGKASLIRGRTLREGQTAFPGETMCSIDPSTGRVVHVTKPTAQGPAKVSTPKYRNGWDRIFGSNTVGEA